MPCCASCPAAPPSKTADPIAPIPYNTLRFCCRDRLHVECRMTTCEISWAITPASCASVSAACTVPRLTNIDPPGSANALISSLATT